MSKSDPPAIREAVVQAIVTWKRRQQTAPAPVADPGRLMWHVINDATEAELLEAMRRLYGARDMA